MLLRTILWRLTRRTDFAEYNLQVISSVYKNTQSADSPCDDLSVSTRDSRSANKIFSGASTDQLILHVVLNQLTTQVTSGAHGALSLGFQGLLWDANVLVRDVVFSEDRCPGGREDISQRRRMRRTGRTPSPRPSPTSLWAPHPARLLQSHRPLPGKLLFKAFSGNK